MKAMNYTKSRIKIGKGPTDEEFRVYKYFVDNCIYRDFQLIKDAQAGHYNLVELGDGVDVISTANENTYCPPNVWKHGRDKLSGDRYCIKYGVKRLCGDSLAECKGRGCRHRNTPCISRFDWCPERYL